MTTETFLVKRRAAYAGEVGLFPSSEMTSEDLALFSMDRLIEAKLSSKATTEARNFMWGIVYKCWQNTDYWIDHHKAMDYLKRQVGFTRTLRNPKTKKLEEHVKSTARISEHDLRVLTDRLIDVICRDYLPGMPANDLRREVEDMAYKTNSPRRQLRGPF